ncbi:hypothetical protein N665_0117s0057 [Sinapis alba]|nr:hypothetical protein N665_0117s0057 [Sinapis alba]
MSVSLNTDEISFDEVVGMLRAHKIEIDGGKKGKGVALKRSNTSRHATEREKRTTESEKNDQKAKVQCHECKGIGHTQMECVNDQKRRREKSLIGIDEIDSEEDSDEEELANFVAFIGITEFVEGETDTDDDQSIAVDHEEIEHQELCQTMVQIGKKNMCLKKEKSWLEDTVSNLIKELDDERKKGMNTSYIKKENERLADLNKILEKQVKAEKDKLSELHSKSEHHYKTVRMITGTKELDKILSLGRQEQTS